MSELTAALAALHLTPEQIALLGRGLVALGEALTQSAVREAEAAGVAAAAQVTTVEQANAVMEAAAAAQESK